VRVDPLFPMEALSCTRGGSVTFELGPRSAWHTLPLGQILIVTAGVGPGAALGWTGPVTQSCVEFPSNPPYSECYIGLGSCQERYASSAYKLH
jgi:hypothetical protein